MLSAGGLAAICEILDQAFETNDFDRFHLELSPWLHRRVSDPRHRGFSDGAYAWQKQSHEISFERSHLPAWSLKLDLIDAAQQTLGAFTVYRACNDKPLLVDINLLTTEFRAALVTSVARATESVDGRLLDDKSPLAASM